MKRIIILSLLLLGSTALPGHASEAAPSAFDTFLTNFDYDTRADMKIDRRMQLCLV